ncbi:hypothetical protein K438DRAFT_2123358 [Mycena galopus ATCC 62051]|nr:hypothetical protein K438DRAFT_2123358 [Mycena galopus ATCC 62051]
MSNAPEYYNAAESDQDDWQHINSDEENALQQPPPGEEGEYHSHAGKEAIFHEIYEKCKPGRSMRVQQMVDAWRSSIPSMVEAYLTLKMSGPLDSDNNPNAWAVQVVGFDECTTHFFVHSDNVQSSNATLILHGYIGASPQKISRAFPIRLFEIYPQIHRVCPRYTIETLATTLTNLHEGPRLKSLSEQLSNAYDAYLEILHQVDGRVDAALGRDGKWHANNVCAPCLYTTTAEPPLKFSFLACMDGNNSLKLIDSTFRAGTVRPDDRASASFRRLTTEQVDVFKDEVMNSQKVSQLLRFEFQSEVFRILGPRKKIGSTLATDVNTNWCAPSYFLLSIATVHLLRYN